MGALATSTFAVFGAVRVTLRAEAEKAFGGKRSAGFVGAGGSGMDGEAHERGMDKKGIAKAKKAALSQGGFLLWRIRGVQRHQIIMHDLDVTATWRDRFKGLKRLSSAL
ncbi:MAG: hypothetical protein ABIZ09_14885 [Rhodoferax sp.]|jgi:hypothetical protein